MAADFSSPVQIQRRLQWYITLGCQICRWRQRQLLTPLERTWCCPRSSTLFAGMAQVRPRKLLNTFYPFYSCQDELSNEEGRLLWGQRKIIPNHQSETVVFSRWFIAPIIGPRCTARATPISESQEHSYVSGPETFAQNHIHSLLSFFTSLLNFFVIFFLALMDIQSSRKEECSILHHSPRYTICLPQTCMHTLMRLSACAGFGRWNKTWTRLDEYLWNTTVLSLSNISPGLFFFFEILSDLNQAVPNHLADESQTR